MDIRRIMLAFLFLLYALPVFSQSVRLGFKVGTRLTGEVSHSITSEITSTESPLILQDIRTTNEGNSITFGPSIEFPMFLHTSLEFGVLYRSLAFLEVSRTREADPDPQFPFDVSLSLRSQSSSLEFPIVLRYRFSETKLRPFVGSGYVYRHLLTPDTFLVDAPNFPLPGEAHFDGRSTSGFVAAAGLEQRIGFLNLSPEVRYTRWGRQLASVSRSNQIDLLFTIGWSR